MNPSSPAPLAIRLMKTGLALLVVSALPSSHGETPNAKPASVTVHVDQVTAEISPLIYGQFIEHLGRAIYGGIYEPGSPLSDKHGFRKDVLEKVQALRTPLMRYPGGTVTKIYHWKDGIGPKENRPVRRNLIWGGEDTNHVGTDEFMSYSQLIGAAPFITVNMSTGTAEEASEWVEYCNADGNSYFAALRRQHGHAEPYRVKYWGLGNEEAAREDAGVLQNPADYVQKAWFFAKLMKLQDPSIELIMVGDDEHWNKTILESLHPIADYISLHLYASTPNAAPSSLFTSVANMEERIKKTAAQIKALTPADPGPLSRWYRFPGRKGPVKIAIDEWGFWEPNGTGAYGLEQTYTWNHALGVASFLNAFQRHADVVGMATWAQTVNMLAPIMTDEQRSICQTIYYPLALYRELSGTRHVAADVTCGTLPDTEQLPVLDVASSIDDAGRTLTLALVNRSETEHLDVALTVAGAKTSGAWTAHTLTAPSVRAANTLQEPDKNVVEYHTTSIASDTPSYRVPAHTIAILQVALAK